MAGLCVRAPTAVAGAAAPHHVGQEKTAERQWNSTVEVRTREVAWEGGARHGAPGAGIKGVHCWWGEVHCGLKSWSGKGTAPQAPRLGRWLVLLGWGAGRAAPALLQGAHGGWAGCGRGCVGVWGRCTPGCCGPAARARVPHHTPTAPSYAPLMTPLPSAAASTRTASSCPSALRTHCQEARSQKRMVVS